MILTRGLSFAYSGQKPIAFPDVHLSTGGVLLLTGASGCGKSTWLALVSGLVSAKDGLLRVAGQDLDLLRGSQMDKWRANTIGFLPQKLHLSAALTVSKNLELAQWAAGQAPDAKAIARCLATLGVDDLIHRKVSRISGGQAQRVALARAVLMQPQLILADEPTASLDDEAANGAVQLLVQTAHSFGAGLVIATHDARVVRLLDTFHSVGPVQHLVLTAGRRTEEGHSV